MTSDPEILWFVANFNLAPFPKAGLYFISDHLGGLTFPYNKRNKMT